MKYSLLLLLVAWCSVADAQSYKPAANETLAIGSALPLTDQMVALQQRITMQPEDSDLLKLTALYLQGARQPGYDSWFHEAEYWLSKVSSDKHGSIDYLLLLADLEQQQHQFDSALTRLEQVFQQHPQHLSASLMAARIYLATAHHQAAQQACARLWQQDLFLFSVCSYEVAGRKGDWQQSYTALKALYQRQQSLPLAIELWLRGILAEQAEQTGQLAEARDWLSPVLAQAPTSLWLKWADLSLALGDDNQVYQQLLTKHQQLGVADSLLVRLAAAEQRLNKQPVIKPELAQRITVRLARGDTDHAADIAHYYLKVTPDAAAALHWAELNYLTAKEPDDVVLLEQSKLALRHQQRKN